MTDEIEDGGRTPEEQRIFAEGTRALMGVAIKARRCMPPIHVAGMFLGTGANELVNAIGREGAASYLRELADEIAAATDAPGGRH